MDSKFKAEDEENKVIAVDTDVIDLYLMWKTALLYAVSRSKDELRTKMKTFLMQYYKEDEVDTIIEDMFRQGIWIILPKAAPFVREYYDAVLSAYEFISQVF